VARKFLTKARWIPQVRSWASEEKPRIVAEKANRPGNASRAGMLRDSPQRTRILGGKNTFLTWVENYIGQKVTIRRWSKIRAQTGSQPHLGKVPKGHALKLPPP